MTTHSPQFLDAFKSIKPTTTVVKWENGETKLNILVFPTGGGRQSRSFSAKFGCKLKCSYKKIVDGKALFANLDPNTVYDKCPKFKELLDEMLNLAQSAGL